jgi:hypothetical protein
MLIAIVSPGGALIERVARDAAARVAGEARARKRARIVETAAVYVTVVHIGGAFVVVHASDARTGVASITGAAKGANRV